MTASVLFSPSAVNCPLTVSVLSLSVVVMKTLSAERTYIAGKSSFSMFTPSSTSCTFAVSSAFTLTVQFLALPLIVYTPSSVMSIVLLSAAVMFCDSVVSAVCSRSR